MSPDSPYAPNRPPHPLATQLIERLADRPGARVLEIGQGSGRNTRALRDAGFHVETLDSHCGANAAAALSTHALLHGTPTSLAALLREIASRLEPGAPLYATFGSIRDARYREGERIEEYVYAPIDGDERGIAHAFFDEARLRAMLEEQWVIESFREVEVDAVAGSWAHHITPLKGSVHWFVMARRR